MKTKKPVQIFAYLFKHTGLSQVVELMATTNNEQKTAWARACWKGKQADEFCSSEVICIADLETSADFDALLSNTNDAELRSFIRRVEIVWGNHPHVGESLTYNGTLTHSGVVNLT